MHETRKSLAERSIDILIDYRWILAGILFVATAVLAFFVGGVTRDPPVRSGIDTNNACGFYRPRKDRPAGFKTTKTMAVHNFALPVLF
jgi:hypothetical protein